MTERLKVLAWKARWLRKGSHGFKSHSLCHCEHMKEEEQILETEDPIISVQKNFARVAQRLEQLPYKQLAGGSTPSPRTI